MGANTKIVILTRGDFITMLMLQPLMRCSTPAQIRIVLVQADSNRRTGFLQLKAMWEEYDYRYFFFELIQFVFFTLASTLVRDSRLSVNSVARKSGYEVLRTADVNSEAVMKFVSDWQPDLILSAKCPQNIDMNLLNISRYPAINIHGSLLPQYAGRAPHFWAMSCNEQVIGFTVHEMTSRFDEGRILHQESIPVTAGSSVFCNIVKVSRASGAAITTIIEDVLDQKIPYAQDISNRSYYSSPTSRAVDNLSQLGHPLFHFSEFILEAKRSKVQS